MADFDVVMALLVAAGLAATIALITPSFEASVRPLLPLALLEYLTSCVAQMIYSRVVVEGGDTLLYASVGGDLAKFLDTSFDVAAPELTSMLFQQPSRFDGIVLGGGSSNTSSMYAMTAWLLYLLRGSEYGTQMLVTGLSMFGSLSIYGAFRDACPEASPRRLFIAAVMFPSISFWVAALHKESFCLIGMGGLFAAWRAVYAGRWLRAIVYATGGVTLILLFRAPVIPPLLLGLAIFVAMERLQRFRGVDAVVLGPIYVALGLAMLAVGVVLVARVNPVFGLDQLGETFANRQAGWAQSRGDSSLDDLDIVPESLAGQMLRMPIGLLNALFRPQFFDVHSVGTAVGAFEISVVTWLTLVSFHRHGARGLISRIRQSPFLLMCAAVTVVGCAFVGVATLNLGSLARYRVPFLPFYGSLVLLLAERSASRDGEVTTSRSESRGDALAE